MTVEITTDPLNFVCLLKKYFDAVDNANNLLMEAYSSGKDYSIPSSKVRRGAFPASLLMLYDNQLIDKLIS